MAVAAEIWKENGVHASLEKHFPRCGVFHYVTSTVIQSDSCWWPTRHVCQQRRLSYAAWNCKCLHSRWTFYNFMPVCTQTMLNPPKGSVGTRAAVGGFMEKRRTALAGTAISLRHIVLPEWKQRCTWQHLTATTKGVGKSLWLSKTPHCSKGLSMGFWEDILQLVTVTEAAVTWHEFPLVTLLFVHSAQKYSSSLTVTVARQIKESLHLLSSFNHYTNQCVSVLSRTITEPFSG